MQSGTRSIVERKKTRANKLRRSSRIFWRLSGKPESEAPREALIVRSRANVDTLCWIEAVTIDKDHAEPGQRLAAPASRRTGRVGTTLDVHLEAEPLALACEHRLELGLGACAFRDPRLPRNTEQL